jgi:hypothetical protein
MLVAASPDQEPVASLVRLFSDRPSASGREKARTGYPAQDGLREIETKLGGRSS